MTKNWLSFLSFGHDLTMTFSCSFKNFLHTVLTKQNTHHNWFYLNKERQRLFFFAFPICQARICMYTFAFILYKEHIENIIKEPKKKKKTWRRIKNLICQNTSWENKIESHPWLNADEIINNFFFFFIKNNGLDPSVPFSQLFYATKKKKKIFFGITKVKRAKEKNKEKNKQHFFSVFVLRNLFFFFVILLLNTNFFLERFENVVVDVWAL